MKTNPHYTETTAGRIPHLVTAALTMPVRLVRVPGADLMAPETAQDGRYAYALPGGGRWVAPSPVATAGEGVAGAEM